MKRTEIQVPEIVRIKGGALSRLGLYLRRPGFRQVVVLHSHGLQPELLAALSAGFDAEQIETLRLYDVETASVETAVEILGTLPDHTAAIVGLGGGKALDVSKYVATLASLPYFAAPTSLSNDGFSSPQSSLTLHGRKRSTSTGLPYAVVVDLDVCARAPLPLWHSGVGDLMSKVTAVYDWKLAFHARGTPVNDLAALLSDATVYQFLACPMHDENGYRLLATALMLNGVAMEIAGSSRPASGSEHLISHALEEIGGRPALHGIQTGTAAYILSRIQQNEGHERIAALFNRIGFWDSARQQPFSRSEWQRAVALAPAIKRDFYTILSERDCWPEIDAIIDSDANLAGVFVD